MISNTLIIAWRPRWRLSCRSGGLSQLTVPLVSRNQSLDTVSQVSLLCWKLLFWRWLLYCGVWFNIHNTCIHAAFHVIVDSAYQLVHTYSVIHCTKILSIFSGWLRQKEKSRGDKWALWCNGGPTEEDIHQFQPSAI